MVKLTITPDAADTLLDTERADSVPDTNPMFKQLQDATETRSDVETDISRKAIEEIISDTLSMDEFGLQELMNVDGMPEFYRNRIDYLAQRYQDDEISILELENKLEPLLEELMIHEDDLGF